MCAVNYILIDNLTHEVWGETLAPDPVSACRRVDEINGDSGTTYNLSDDKLEAAERGYQVYRSERPIGLDRVGSVPVDLVRSSYKKVANVRVR